MTRRAAPARDDTACPERRAPRHRPCHPERSAQRYTPFVIPSGARSATRPRHPERSAQRGVEGSAPSYIRCICLIRSNPPFLMRAPRNAGVRARLLTPGPKRGRAQRTTRTWYCVRRPAPSLFSVPSHRLFGRGATEPRRWPAIFRLGCVWRGAVRCFTRLAYERESPCSRRSSAPSDSVSWRSRSDGGAAAWVRAEFRHHHVSIVS